MILYFFSAYFFGQSTLQAQAVEMTRMRHPIHLKVLSCHYNTADVELDNIILSFKEKLKISSFLFKQELLLYEIIVGSKEGLMFLF